MFHGIFSLLSPSKFCHFKFSLALLYQHSQLLFLGRLALPRIIIFYLIVPVLFNKTIASTVLNHRYKKIESYNIILFFLVYFLLQYKSVYFVFIIIYCFIEFTVLFIGNFCIILSLFLLNSFDMLILHIYSYISTYL